MFSIYCNFPFPPASLEMLRAGLSSHRLLLSDKPPATPLTIGSPDPILAEADIAMGQPDIPSLIRLQRLRWTHLTSAGYDRYDLPELRQAFAARSAIMTNSSAVFDEPCAQQILAYMLYEARQFSQTMQTHVTAQTWKGRSLRMGCKLLQGQNVLLVGYGNIARRLVELLSPMGLQINGIRRRPRGDERVKIWNITQADQVLPLADHVIDLLPGGPETEHFFGPRRLAMMKSTAVFYNVGRGSTVDQAALQSALETGRLGAAYLDVTTPEPLPAEHPLWNAPRCHITPHTAGGHADQFERMVLHFLDNFRRFENHESLINRVF
jgi:phosphoglycerate dehydrogenase-like enzyme